MTDWTELITDSPASRTRTRPPEHEVSVERGLRIPMRDGTELGAMLWQPKTSGRYPVIVERGPHRLEERTGQAGAYYAERGYVVVSVSLRGSGESGGDFVGPMPGSPPGDGSDTIEWAAAQPWSNGHCGMICGSVSGFTAQQTAVEAPSHLSALFVRQASGFQLYRTLAPGGAFALATLQGVAASWIDHRLGAFSQEQRTLAESRLREYQEANARTADQNVIHHPNRPGRTSIILPATSVTDHLPLTPHPLFAGVADHYNDWLAHPEEDEWWRPTDLARLVDRVQVPVCHLGGWFDPFIGQTLLAFTLMRERAATSEAREGQRLIVGPWLHGPENVGKTRIGDLEFERDAALDFLAFRGRWYDHALQGRSNGVENDPRVWLYVIGAERWIGCDTWPPPGLTPTAWFLHRGNGPGILSTEAPTTREVADGFAYDPENPIPSLRGGGFFGLFGMGVDQSSLEHRLLTYTSTPLAQPLALIGPLRAILIAASSAPDTDWIVKLTWVRPDETSIVLSGGILRARYRESFGRPRLLEPGQPTRFTVEMMPLSVVIPAGHRLRVTISSSDYPAFDRNLNTGGPIGKETQGRVATNQIFHDDLRPSHLLLPVMEGRSP